MLELCLCCVCFEVVLAGGSLNDRLVARARVTRLESCSLWALTSIFSGETNIDDGSTKKRRIAPNSFPSKLKMRELPGLSVLASGTLGLDRLS